MLETVIEIEMLEYAIIVLREGASDEKHTALWNLERMLETKKLALEEFEKEVA